MPTHHDWLRDIPVTYAANWPRRLLLAAVVVTVLLLLALA